MELNEQKIRQVSISIRDDAEAVLRRRYIAYSSPPTLERLIVDAVKEILQLQVDSERVRRHQWSEMEEEIAAENTLARIRGSRSDDDEQVPFGR